MKLLPLLLAVSLVANVALVVVQFTPRRGGAGAEAGPDERTVAAGANGGAASRPAAHSTGGNAGEVGPTLVGALNAGNLEAVRDQLRAAGVDEDILRTLLSAQIARRFEARMKSIAGANNPQSVWWKHDAEGFWGGASKEKRASMRALQQEMKEEQKRLLGEDAVKAFKDNPWMERQYGSVPKEKWEALMQIEQDYNELSSDLQRETSGFRMPGDAEKEKFIRAEQRRDLAALLTPQELAEFELRQSPTAGQLRWRMTQMDASEAEYRAIYALQKDFEDQFGENARPSGNRTEAEGKARSAAEQAMNARLKATLGSERYLAYQLAGDYEFRQLVGATKRFGLPENTPVRVLKLREEVPQAAVKIADDPALSFEQKKAALKVLADATRQRVQTTLGREVAQVYFDGSGMRWLNDMEQGTIVTFNEDGGQNRRRLERPKPPTPPTSGKDKP